MPCARPGCNGVRGAPIGLPIVTGIIGRQHCLDSVIDAIGLTACKKGLHLLVDLSADCPTTLKGDPTSLRQALVNLASNAIKFTAAGEVVLNIQTGPSHNGRPTMIFTVKDSGIGMSRAAQDSLFTPFVQADASTTRRYVGTGLGLAISRRLIHAMGGDITAKSELGQGSSFTFNISFGHLSPTSRQQLLRPGIAPGCRVLLAYDHSLTAGILAKQLMDAGVVVERVSSTQQALGRWKELAAAARSPHFLIARDELPDASGSELAREVRHLDPTHDTKLVIILPLNRSLAAEDRSLSTAVCHSPLKCVALVKVLQNPEASAPQPNPSQPPNLQPLAGLRVLLADDNPVNRKLGERQLKNLGMIVTLVCDGRQALEQVTVREFDFVLMDCQMPEMDGYEATRLLRRKYGGALDPDIPVVALTAPALAGDRDRCLAAGMNDYLTKPVDPRRLTDVIINVMRNKEEAKGRPRSAIIA